MDPQGNIFGTAGLGGGFGNGVVFELTSSADGSWSETVLHNFGVSPGDGTMPVAAVTRDAAGNLYGTTIFGGGLWGEGTVFELSPSLSDKWSGKILHNFGGNYDGWPDAPLAMGSAGTLYGTKSVGGGSGVGVVYEVTP